MGAGNMSGAAGRDLSRRMREQQGDGEDPNAMGGFGNSPLRQAERRPQAGVQDARDRDGGGRGAFSFGGGNEMGGLGAPDTAFGEERRDADLSTPEGDAPEPDALRAAAGSRRRQQRDRANQRQARFFAMRGKAETGNRSGETRGTLFGAGFASRNEQMPGDGAGAPRMQPDAGIGSDVGFDFEAMMGGPKQQFEEEVQSRRSVPGQSLQAGQQAAQIRSSLAERRGASRKRRMPTIDEDYFSI